MIDLTLLREHPEQVIELLKKKDPKFDADKLVELEKATRKARIEVEALRSKKNELAKSAQQGLTDELRQESIDVSKRLKSLEEELVVLQEKFNELYLRAPNLPRPEVPFGGKEANQETHEWGSKPTFAFEPKNHVALGNQLGWFDFDVAAQMSGSNFALYKGDSVSLMYALTMMMVKHNREHGFSPIIPPYLVNAQSLYNGGNFPKFVDEVYGLEDRSLFLAPTGEVMCTNMHRDTIFTQQELPVRYTTWTSCFRKEAGGYGATERGLIRIHQFEKVELYSYALPEESDQELSRMLACAEGLLQKLGLHYRVMLLAAQDTSLQAAKTYDIEVWMPGQGAYYEVSSVSNCTDFQTRRAQVRFKRTPESKTELVHTLNGSSLALPRLMVALMETYQQADGSIALPDSLKQISLW